MAFRNQPPDNGDSLHDDEVSDEEANEEIDIPTSSFTPSAPPVAHTPRPAPSPPPPHVAAAGDDTTPSVREAIDKAADVLRELRGER